MKRFFLLITVFTIAATMSNAQNNYSKQWQEIDTLILSKDLPQSALKKVKLLYADAKKNGIKDHVIKALLYRISLENDISEENPNASAALLKAEINTAKDAVQKSILYVLLAYNYESYFNQHAWQLYERSKTVNFKKEDIATWSADDFNREIAALYEKALQSAAALQKTSLQPYAAIIIKGNAGNLRPTLYDLIAHKALDHFKDDNNYITRPDYAFEIKEEAALSTAETFIQHDFKTTDSTSNMLMALQLFQQLMRFHKADKDPSAFIDVNLERIVWVNEKTIADEKEVLYKTALEEITSKYADNTVAAQAWYLLAKIYADKAETYKPFGDTTQRYAYVKAKEIIDARLKQDTAASEGSSNMLQLLHNISSVELKTEVESISIPGQPFRMLVSYRNIETMHIRIIDAAVLNKLDVERWDDNFWMAVSKLSFQKTYLQSLPATNDFQQHAVEIMIDALKTGSYAILASGGKDFDAAKDKMILQRFDVSNISYINNGNDYFVLHRETGVALADAEVKYSVEIYDTKKRDYVTGAPVNIPVDSNGMFHLPERKANNRRNNSTLHFTYGNDTLETRSYDYYRPYLFVPGEADSANFERNNTRIFFFTDRSIYRPGQTIFFKGIAVTKDKTTNSSKIVAAKTAMHIVLKDVNGKETDSLSVTTNEYGSFTGKFILPQNALTGNFSIVADQLQGSAGISVEEYKRPKFYVEFDTLKSAYKLNDTIKITGHAKSYAGNAMDNATVKFNVQRNTRFLYPWMFWKTSWPRSSSQQIADGIIKTDAAGKFEFSFVAKPDNSINKSTEPVFDFSIEAAVTDNNGETREGNTSLSVGYKSLQLSVSVPAKAEIKSFKEIGITTQNLSGQNIATDVKISITPLQSPANIYRERLWEQPDQFSMSKTEFEKVFPYDLYENENDHRNWAKKESVITSAINTGTHSRFTIHDLRLVEGWYIIEATAKDKEGNTVKDVQYIQLYNKDSSGVASKETAWDAAVAASVQPGEQAKLLIGSSYENVHLILNTDYKAPAQRDTNYYAFYQLNNQKQIYSYTVKEEDRNGLGIWYAFVKNNRVYTGGTSVIIPYLNKDLQIDYATYRNKTEPGSEEKWTVTVKGSDKEKATAELLTAMYDASLDQFKPHRWDMPDVWPIGYSNNNWHSRESFKTNNSEENYLPNTIKYFEKKYSELATSGEVFWNMNGEYNKMYAASGRISMAENMLDASMEMRSKPGSVSDITVRGTTSGESASKPLLIIDGIESSKNINEISSDDVESMSVLNREQAIKIYGAKAANGVVIITTKSGTKKGNSEIQPRKNFNETAFFFPQLHADTAGNYTFSFTIPEALTQWKWLSFAHTKELAFGLQQQTIVTQKTLMVQPNLPRFLREGDKLELTARISNLSDSALTGTATLQLFDAITNQPVDGLFQSVFPDQYFTAEAKQSTAIKFPVTIPFNYSKPLTIKIVAKAGAYADGEENTIPVLTNRMLVTETLPLYMRGEGSKAFTFEKLLNNASPTLTNESITVEYTPQPVWYAVQALPYIMEYPHECAEQIFNRFYANALAAYIVSKHPRIKEVFEKWRADSISTRGEGRGEGLISNLEKNQELKQILLNETPWVFDAANETQQRKNIALLFNVVSMSSSMDKALQELQQMQMDNGAFPWFKGGYADRYITQYILTGIGKLRNLGAINKAGIAALQEIETKALQYADLEMVKDKKNIKEKELNNNNLGSTQIQYLYMRSFFNGNKASDASVIVQKYYQQQAKQYWIKQSNYLRAMIAATLYRNNEQGFVDKNIIPSILENAVTDSAKGMYWKNNVYGYYWYQSPIEQQALMIELMNEMLQQKENEEISTRISDMQTWLLLNKQTNNWKTTKATADACYALLLAGSGLSDQPLAVSINLGDYSINSVEKEQQSGTGYIKERINGADVKQSMGNIYVGVSNPIGKSATSPPSWGAVYWQYFEDLDKITPAESPLSLNKKLFIEKNTSAGKVLQPVNDGDELHVGDKVVMQIILKSDRDMEYLHLKDMRAASMEPTNVISGYKWQDGLSYYESTKDASTDFFISYLPQGAYVFEYPAYITHAGNFSVGVANIQCMYAPEFSAHSGGIRINVENSGQ